MLVNNLKHLNYQSTYNIIDLIKIRKLLGKRGTLIGPGPYYYRYKFNLRHVNQTYTYGERCRRRASCGGREGGGGGVRVPSAAGPPARRAPGRCPCVPRASPGSRCSPPSAGSSPPATSPGCASPPTGRRSRCPAPPGRRRGCPSTCGSCRRGRRGACCCRTGPTLSCSLSRCAGSGPPAACRETPDAAAPRSSISYGSS